MRAYFVDEALRYGDGCQDTGVYSKKHVIGLHRVGAVRVLPEVLLLNAVDKKEAHVEERVGQVAKRRGVGWE